MSVMYLFSTGVLKSSLPCTHIPKLGGIVCTARGEVLKIRTELYTVDGMRMTDVRTKFQSGSGVP